MPYNKIKKSRIDICNICLLKKPLSWDHVPPKGGITLSSVEIKNIFDSLGGRIDPQFDISQNGVKYRTICSDCNSKIGSEFDPILNKLNSTISLFLKSTLVLPKVTYLKTKPIRLIKSILGHLVAAKVNIDDVVLDKQIRNFIFNDEATIPPEINIFYWIYPYDNIIIMRDFATLSKPGDKSSFSFCHLLKYFPVAFMVTTSSEFRNLESLTKYRDLSIDEEVEIKVNLNLIKEWNWPEKVDKNNMIFLSETTQKGIIAKPRK